MTSTTRAEVALPPAIHEFVDRIGSADWAGMEAHVTDDVLYDASVPGWHYQLQGAAGVLDEYRREWSGTYRWEVIERHTVVGGDAVVLMIEMHGHPMRDDPPVVCRLSNLFRLRDGRISEHRYTCCGEWGPEVVRHIEAHAPKVLGSTR